MSNSTSQREPIYYYITDTMDVKHKTARSKFYLKHKKCHNFFTSEHSAQKARHEIKKAYNNPKIVTDLHNRITKLDDENSTTNDQLKEMAEEHATTMHRTVSALAVLLTISIVFNLITLLSWPL